jgi:hypothetical protein
MARKTPLTGTLTTVSGLSGMNTISGGTNYYSTYNPINVPTGVITTGSTTTPNIVNNPKPIFVMRLRDSLSDWDFSKIKDDIFKSEMSNDYHVICVRNSIDKDEFEMYNADKIERQEFNKMINQITKTK